MESGALSRSVRFDQTETSDCGSRNGNWRQRTADVMVTMAVFAPTPRARVRMRMAVVAGERRRERCAKWRSYSMLTLYHNCYIISNSCDLAAATTSSATDAALPARQGAPAAQTGGGARPEEIGVSPAE